MGQYETRTIDSQGVRKLNERLLRRRRRNWELMKTYNLALKDERFETFWLHDAKIVLVLEWTLFVYSSYL